MGNKVVNLDQMSLKNAIRVMMEDSEFKTYKELAEKLDIKEYTFRSALHNDSLRVRDLKRVADILGYKIIMEQK